MLLESLSYTRNLIFYVLYVKVYYFDNIFSHTPRESIEKIFDKNFKSLFCVFYSNLFSLIFETMNCRETMSSLPRLENR